MRSETRQKRPHETETRRGLTLLLQAGHHLHVSQVLQFVPQSDAAVLGVAVQGRLGTEARAPEAAAFEWKTKPELAGFHLGV